MSSLAGSLRRWVLAPSLSRVSRVARGVPDASPETVRRLEAVPQAVVCGFEWAIDATDPWELERRLGLVEPALRGFAYEGAAMAFTVLDATGRGHRTRDLLTGHGAPHLLLAYIGVGFAMARLPRVLWRRVLPDLPVSEYHPTMSWLAVDGYGFDLAYFDPQRWIRAQEVPSPYPWQGRADYFPRAVDQGIGRAVWFLHGADPDRVIGELERFDDRRRADLWSGVGLAATFAGGCPPAGLARLRDAAGEDRGQLGVGAVFAAQARVRAGHVPSHTHDAVRALAGLEVLAAVRLVRATTVGPGETDAHDGGPRYETWRARIRRHLTTSETRSPTAHPRQEGIFR